MRESQKVERLGLAFPSPFPVRFGKPPELTALPPLPGFQPFLDQPWDPGGGYMLDELHHPSVVDIIDEPPDVCVQHIVHLFPLERDRPRVQRLMLAPSWPESIREAPK